MNNKYLKFFLVCFITIGIIIKSIESSKCIKPCLLTLDCVDDTQCLICFCPVEFKCPEIKNCNANCGLSIEVINGKQCQKCRC